jgi:hypothetical protein
VLREAAEYRSDLGLLQKWKVHIIASATLLFVSGITAVCVIYREQIANMATAAATAVVGLTVVIVGAGAAFLVLMWTALWLIFPFVVYFGFRDMRQSAQRTQELLKACVAALQKTANSKEEAFDGNQRTDDERGPAGRSPG